MLKDTVLQTTVSTDSKPVFFALIFVYKRQ